MEAIVERIWEKFLTDRDREVLIASGYGSHGGFGKKPALLVIDVSYGFTGDKPEPILDSIKQWRNSCGAESWTAISVIKDLADLFRSKRLPVIYSTGFLRQDNWDAGGWAWKNNLTAESAPVESTNRDPDEIVSELAPQPQDIVVYKQKPSVFFGSNLISYLTLLGCDSIIVTGCTTSGCVRATVVDAFSYNIRVSVAEDACFYRSEASHAISLCDMHAKYADVMPAREIKTFIASLADGLFPNLPQSIAKEATDACPPMTGLAPRTTVRVETPERD
jgi:maleamate amidohydrolase